MRLGWLGLLVVLAGCAVRPQHQSTQPVSLLVVFADEFHSGLLVPRADAPPELLPMPGRFSPDWAWAAFHFGERRWIRGEADGAIDALRLVVFPGDGGMQVDLVPGWIHDRGGTCPDRERIWLFPLGADALSRLQARLRAWASPGLCEALEPTTCWWPTPHAWSVWFNCHDFTADVLSAAGIDVARPPIMLAGGMRLSLDRAWAERCELLP